MPEEENMKVADSAPKITGSNAPPSRADIAAFGDVIVNVQAILGTVQIPIEQFLKLGRGAIIELDQHKDADLCVEVNGYVVAKGEITVVEDKVGITITDVVLKNKTF